ncbi:hypothetical protein VNO78_32746 [Psophocarpus tetragonolobus]|uniref:Uncharacterized protein n=1 Tax=Psophocarpus tetragonolobus TaxID=3891 RepID=A0AAN9RP83_PSOTE
MGMMEDGREAGRESQNGRRIRLSGLSVSIKITILDEPKIREPNGVPASFSLFLSGELSVLGTDASDAGMLETCSCSTGFMREALIWSIYMYYSRPLLLPWNSGRLSDSICIFLQII